MNTVDPQCFHENSFSSVFLGNTTSKAQNVGTAQVYKYKKERHS
jgi:hypothetical protein